MSIQVPNLTNTAQHKMLALPSLHINTNMTPIRNLPPLPPSPRIKPRAPIQLRYFGNESRQKSQYSNHLIHGESVVLTKNANGNPSEDEIYGKRYKVHAPEGWFVGFLDPETNCVYRSPSSLCKNKLPPRIGTTNEWAGPLHVLIMRRGTWIPIKYIH